ncbi:MAG: hypothetical protein C4520_20865 [Candidatus Abyssobacteria bacterium SURF_5]|uniref:Uncharacterized protein n=1 Tax=Abyssobacteria bacterium (strain SURF_5) TaxID=2093360 RepID=A0A3A4NIA3_ABYX5|nr:MAG: hypothetical protein C4520_20865 [Candidatus Abyssubacteria bacterium SURF_5]
MSPEMVIVFRPFPLLPGQKIRIDNGPRGGDWEVMDVSDRKIRLRCPLSGREVEWDRFCYFVEQRDDLPWPQREA